MNLKMERNDYQAKKPENILKNLEKDGTDKNYTQSFMRLMSSLINLGIILFLFIFHSMHTFFLSL